MFGTVAGEPSYFSEHMGTQKSTHRSIFFRLSSTTHLSALITFPPAARLTKAEALQSLRDTAGGILHLQALQWML